MTRGPKPALDPLIDYDECRAIRELVRGPRPVAWKKESEDRGFSSHGTLFKIAAKYEEVYDLAPDQAEDPEDVTLRRANAAQRKENRLAA